MFLLHERLGRIGRQGYVRRRYRSGVPLVNCRGDEPWRVYVCELVLNTSEHSSAILPCVGRWPQRHRTRRSTLFFSCIEKQNLPWIEGVQRAKRSQRLPVVLTRHAVKCLLIYTHVLNRGGRAVVSPLDAG